jgi:hypothetical protein
MFKLRLWWAITRATWREWHTYRNRTLFAFRMIWRSHADMWFLDDDGHILFYPF